MQHTFVHRNQTSVFTVLYVKNTIVYEKFSMWKNQSEYEYATQEC